MSPPTSSATEAAERRDKLASRVFGAPIAFAGALAVILAFPGGADAVARARPDLKVSAVSAPVGPLAAGSSLSARVKTRNTGRRRAKGSQTALYLSPDARKSRDDVRLGATRTGALKPHRSKRRQIQGTIPASTPPAAYRLLGCADDRRKVRERKERNNCRAAKAPITVTGGGPVANPAADDDGDGHANAVDCAPNDPSVHPGAADRPDVPAFRDTNCDGIDGDEARAVFVSPIGNDGGPGTRAQPKRTMASAVSAASVQGKDVYATYGLYTETLYVANGVGVFGGYGTDWSRSLSNETRLNGDGAGGSQGAVAWDVTASTTLQHITLAPQAPTAHGASSYGLRADRSGGLVIEHVVATGATAAAGAAGAPGANGRHGGAGGNGNVPSYASGGAGGATLVGRNGGSGGSGRIDASGLPGSHGLLTAPDAQGRMGGPGGPGGSESGSGGNGTPGSPGDAGTAGADGWGGSGGVVSDAAWTSGSGDRGEDGTHGHGGGGGGAGGADEDGGRGAGGGGGGGGGQGGQGGRGGRGGGGSFGIFLVNCYGAVIRDSIVTASNGGAGARGGFGGSGGTGGPGGLGGSHGSAKGGDGANGGFGGFGGRGGDGGGGAGGPSIALYRLNSDVTTSGNTLVFGSGGTGGSGPGLPGAAGRSSAEN